ncbi:glycosyltransferase family 2 protein [Vibrio campbellii]|uniref:Glycosyltransferase family 2 protein n=1 Tax=Vibrio campbellii TaxID=680 RepID=A0AAE9N0V5_9VIBR|nr:glycosyltransferase family 2 protein [Vibrio campbellii]UTZ26433.1 glycosyltransferase family 2 protein [Vibrio campbellii]
MKVSIVVVTYERPELLSIALDSILSQSHTELEVIIVDDNSPSYLNNKKVIEDKKDSRLVYYRNTENKGACYSRNYGLSLATSKYVAFLDDDDLWDKDKIRQQVNSLNSTNAVLCYTAKRMFKNSDSSCGRVSFQEINEDLPLLSLFNNNVIGTTSCIMVNREVASSCGGFDIDLPAIQDYDFYLRIAAKGKVVSIKEPLTYYRVDTAIKISKNGSKAITASQMIIDKYPDNLKIKRYLFKANLKKALKYRNLKLMIRTISIFNYGENGFF